MAEYKGLLRKMFTKHDAQTGDVSYALNLNNEAVLDMTALVGQEIRLSYGGEKNCVSCGAVIRGKTFSGGYCYPCFSSLPETDLCIMSPDKCHFHKGTCRDSAWGKKHCFTEHVLYLARSSNIKVGITRATQVPTRWMDQGAVEAIVLGRFPDRKQVGDAEKAISAELSDKTSWQKMLKNDYTKDPFDIYKMTARMMLSPEQQKYLTNEDTLYKFKYPVIEYPKKVKSVKFDKTPFFQKKLMGIKGQYLIFEDGDVINLRSHGGYNITLEC